MNIDREIEAALNVDPSPEFLARVRMRIATEPPPRRWGFSWVVVAVGAAAVVVLAVVMTRSFSEKKSVELLTSRALPAIGAAVDVGRSEGPRYQSFRPAPAAVVAVAQPFRAAVAQPDIVIDAREAAAFRRLLAGVGAGRIDLRPVLEPSPFVMTEMAPVEDIQIAPLSIEPLGTGGEGARP